MLNQGEQANYEFSFSSTVEILKESFIAIQIPKVFDARFGPTYSFDYTPGVKYLYSSSSVFYSVCIVDHWLIKCSLSGSVNNDTLRIGLTIRGYNPPNSYTSDFYVYIIGPDQNIQAIYQSTLGVWLNSIPANSLDLYSIILSNNFGTYSNYTFRTIISDNFYAKGCIKFWFPEQYDLEVDNPTSVSCSVIYYNTDNEYGNTVDSINNCITESNWLIYSFPFAIQLSNTYQVDFIAYNIVNPSTGILRKSENDEYFDASDNKVFNNFEY